MEVYLYTLNVQLFLVIGVGILLIRVVTVIENVPHLVN